ncbi:MAG: SGNH/GDSL hydrolase family protein [Chitinivibrionales bacterium]|nr:SGNH/GDSL hydrolase family protein [Chitinivibrionales bacterium]
MNNPFKANMKILFQGDSITDCGRRDPGCAPLGVGYVRLIAANLQCRFPEYNLTIDNRGISGNRAVDLLARLDEDCCALRPDLLSIMIGVNDTWRRYDSNDPTSSESFYGTYHQILAKIKKTINPLLVLCEPFLLPCPEDRKAWRVDLDPKIAIVRELARTFNAIYMPFDGLFAAACTRQKPAYWAEDGVHPTLAGHGFLAAAWLDGVLAKL